MHGNDNDRAPRATAPRGAYRKDARSPKDRIFAEHCDYGDEVLFVEGPPRIQDGSDFRSAPSDRGRVSMFIVDRAYVSFDLGGRSSRPMSVVPGQRIVLVRANRY